MDLGVPYSQTNQKYDAVHLECLGYVSAQVLANSGCIPGCIPGYVANSHFIKSPLWFINVFFIAKLALTKHDPTDI